MGRHQRARTEERKKQQGTSLAKCQFPMVIGFEGRGSLDVVTYGAAAIRREDGRVMNSVTGATMGRREFDAYASKRSAARVAPMRMRPDSDLRGVWVLWLGSWAAMDLFRPDKSELGNVVASGPHCWAFSSIDSIHAYGHRIADGVSAAMIATGSIDIPLLEQAMTLSLRNPKLLALRVSSDPDPVHRRLASILLTESDHEVFCATLRALQGRACGEEEGRPHPRWSNVGRVSPRS